MSAESEALKFFIRSMRRILFRFIGITCTKAVNKAEKEEKERRKQ